MKIFISCICMFAASLTFAQMKTKDSGSKDNTKSIIEQDSNIWNVFKERRSAYCHHHFIMGEFNIQFINLEPHRSRISSYRPNHIIESSSIQSMDPS